MGKVLAYSRTDKRPIDRMGVAALRALGEDLTSDDQVAAGMAKLSAQRLLLAEADRLAALREPAQRINRGGL